MEIRKLTKKEFPKIFKEIPESPKELWVLGNMPDEKLIHLCVVGSRKHTAYGRLVCEKLIAGLKGHPIVIVSGLALGIDGIAHKEAMKAGLKTLVFPGSGLGEKSLYPKTNAILAKEILRSGGCLISEFPPDFRATLWSFARRNRLMAGISKAILVIEAGEKSGTLITARLAIEYNRDLLTVPGSIFSPNSKGTNRLIRMGATPITSSEDILDALGFKTTQPTLFNEISEEEKIILEILETPMDRGEIMENLEATEEELNTVLSAMEIKGLIKEEMGKFWREK